MKNEKETLLDEIEKLIAYGRDAPSINPSLLAYLELDDLKSMKAKFLERRGKLSQEDILWLQKFRKE
jgi:hypothetical protein